MLTVRQIRLMNEVTQEEMANLLEITTQAYVNKETGKTRFYFDEIKKVSVRFNVPLTEIE